jgi:hypothetical protein
MIHVGNISLTRSLSYNLSLHVLDCWVNASQITLKYLFIENGRIVHPSRMAFYVLLNSSWVNVSDYFEYSEGYVELHVEGNSHPLAVLLDFTSSMSVRITALINIRH